MSVKNLLRWMGLCLLTGVILLTGQAGANESFTTTVGMYQGIDLLTGMTEYDPTVLTIVILPEEIERIAAPEIEPLFTFSADMHLHFGFNTSAERPVLVTPDHLTGMVVLKDTPAEAVTPDLLASLTIPAEATAMAVDSADSLVLVTPEGAYVVIGNIAPRPGAQVQFSYRVIDGAVTATPTPVVPEVTPTPGTGAIPEPGTLVLVGVGIMGAIAALRWRRRNRNGQGGANMKCRKLMILLFGLILMGMKATSAAELTVIKVGTGDGDVDGSEIACGPFCSATYEEKTVVQLKATPDDNSKFVGWMVNGEPTNGVIIIDQEDVLVAAKFESTLKPDELEVMWYEGNRKEYAYLSLTEIVVFPAKRRENVYVLEGEFKTAMEEVARLFHPQAKVVGLSQLEITIESPEPVAKERLPGIIAAMKTHAYVHQAGPLFYANPKDPESEIIPTGEIMVQFPASYPEERILAIEREYGLVRFESYPDDPHFFLYQAEDPLKAIDIANRLYESGLVELASPDMIRSGSLDSQLLEGDSFADHWHLQSPEQNGADVISAWNLYDQQVPPNLVRGTGINIAILDDGVEIAHPDLAPNINYNLCFDFLDAYAEGYDPNDLYDPSPTVTMAQLLTLNLPEEKLLHSTSGHGTSVAGIAAGKGFNDIGIYGVAPEAKIVGYRLSDTRIKNGQIVPIKLKDNIALKALELNRDKIHIYNNSGGWGEDYSRTPLLPKVENALKKIADAGKVFVNSAGNEREHKWNSNYIPLTNFRSIIAVAASSRNGRYASYSNPGATILVNAPCSGIPTTDRTGEEGYNPYFNDDGTDYADVDYRKSFAGTSAAAPVVSGVIALMLQANPNLDWRDVRHILLTTADQNPDPNEHWGDAEHLNGAGYRHSYNYGFGRVNARKAVEEALRWQTREYPLLEERKKPVIDTNKQKETIPQNGGEIVKTIEIQDNIKVEFVEVYLDVEHSHWCYLEVTLTSPEGTTSKLAEESFCYTDTMSKEEKYGFKNWRFGSVRHYGELSKGTWKLSIKNKSPWETGTFKRWDIALYGTELPTWKVTTPTAASCTAMSGEAGVTCQFDAGQSSVILRPKGEHLPNQPYLWLDDPTSVDAAHAGVYCLPRGGADWQPTLQIAVNLTPEPEWLDFRAPAAARQELWCPETLEEVPGENGPPSDSTETTSLVWEVTTQTLSDTDQCRLRIAATPSNAATPRTVTLDVEPASLCDSLGFEGTETITVTAMYVWELEESVAYTAWYRLPDEVKPYGDWIDRGWNYSECEGEYSFQHLVRMVCAAENSDWKTLPTPPTFTLIPPGEEGFAPRQVINVTYDDCRWGEERVCRWHDIITGGCGGYLYICLGQHSDPRCDAHPAYQGWYGCKGTETVAKWDGIASCIYHETRRFCPLTTCDVLTLPVLSRLVVLSP